MAVKIFIDQGHNPEKWNTGALGFGLREQDITYNVGVYLAELLEADPRFEVRLSRTSPDQILGSSNSTSLQVRVAAANHWPADYFLSIHANANENPEIDGTEMYVYEEGSEAYWLARHLLNGVTSVAGTEDNGVRLNPSFYVLRKTKMPAVLAELAYITNEEDAQKLENDQLLFARGLYDGLLSYFAYDNIVFNNSVLYE